MKMMTYDEINNVLAVYVTCEKLPFGWSGTLLDLLEYSELPLDARVSAALILSKDNKPLLEAFSAWMEKKLQAFEPTHNANRAVQCCGKWREKGQVNMAAGFMRAAVRDSIYKATSNLGKAAAASIDTAGLQAVALYKLIKINAKGNN